jgi:hypothetical protein
LTETPIAILTEAEATAGKETAAAAARTMVRIVFREAIFVTPSETLRKRTQLKIQRSSEPFGPARSGNSRQIDTHCSAKFSQRRRNPYLSWLQKNTYPQDNFFAAASTASISEEHANSAIE